MKRLGIFFFYDGEGKADRYVIYLLQKVLPFLSELTIVVNGDLDTPSKAAFEALGAKLLLRSNEGLDATAYKYAIEYYGYETLKDFDEVLCFNFTFFGPFYPLETMFAEMETRSCDWWGLYHITLKPPHIEWTHIPSFFVVYRKSLLTTKAFKEYWQTLPTITTYDDSVTYHEQRQTPFFDQKGFTNAVYFDFGANYPTTSDPTWTIRNALPLTLNDRFPFIKRRNFYIEKGKMIYPNSVKILTSLRQVTDYPIEMIVENLFRTQDIEGIMRYLTSRITLIKWNILAHLHPKQRKRTKYKDRLIVHTATLHFYNLLHKLNS